MTRLVPLIVLLLLLLLPAASVLAGDLPQVLQPNTTAYSASEIAALTQAIGTLTEALNDYDMASRCYFSAGDWSSRDFAAYTAGVLSGKGYETVLVSGDGWPDGTHTWVLVGVPLGSSNIAWIPVEASPNQGHSQQILGTIPSTTNAAGSVLYKVAYLGFSDVLQLPPNLPPIAKIRRPDPSVEVGDGVRFMAIGSSDSDGEIVLYQWSFGDGETAISSIWSVRHEFEEAGEYVVSLTAIDNCGKNATTNITLNVVEAEEWEASSSSSGGCGCGG